jgi:hypothetical protein
VDADVLDEIIKEVVQPQRLSKYELGNFFFNN